MAGTKDPNSLSIFSIKQIRQVLSFFNILAYWNWNTIWRNWKNKNGKNKTLMQKWITYTILNNTDGSTGSIRNQNKNFKDQGGGAKYFSPHFLHIIPFLPPPYTWFFCYIPWITEIPWKGEILQTLHIFAKFKGCQKKLQTDCSQK